MCQAVSQVPTFLEEVESGLNPGMPTLFHASPLSSQAAALCPWALGMMYVVRD